MWLHGHPVNADRARHGRLPITALWLWGGGGAREGIDLGAEPVIGSDTTDTVPASFVRGARARRDGHADAGRGLRSTIRTCTASGA